MNLFGREHSDEPCPSCLQLLGRTHDVLDPRMVLPLVLRAGPMTRNSKLPFKHICYDCAAAEGLMHYLKGTLTFPMARIATGNDRMERIRLPGIRVGVSTAPVSVDGDFETLAQWQEMKGFCPFLRDDMRKEEELLEKEGWA